ncbi:MAG: hypothetical protein R2711_16795 [Acidimicrobiales bacterium]
MRGLLESQGVRLAAGCTGRLIDDHHVEVTGSSGATEVVEADTSCCPPGRACIPEALIDGERVLTTPRLPAARAPRSDRGRLRASPASSSCTCLRRSART